ncbi:hypothetical protein [Vibrio parahaemolyticus]|nr:hypothetical protein [Vibrio parahaemolyticus]MCX8774045.1 hypothetical protein [Vibrio parahaemolyticus]TOP45208.1 hypothetical protein CGH15_04925 [Vibrio parahaemolyticus]HCG6958887.1 hypothetical protein [Vibrio parahaemolyticus]HCG7285555.1 hypothetical protein [Vibrio parahaemolyticus]
MKLKAIEIKALKTLWKSSKGLDAFSFFRRLDLSFSDYSKTIRSLRDKSLIEEVTDDFFLITSEGIALLTYKSSLKKERPWRTVPDRFLSTKISTSDFYVPSLYLLDMKTFKIH